MADKRKWQMVRLGAGDYLLPSNNRETLWRIRKYSERDGTLTRWNGTVVNNDFWMLSRWRYPLADAAENDLTEDALWIDVAFMLPTRQAAIDYAMEQEDG